MNIKSVEHIIDSQYQELISVFKPQFGNQRHIEIREYSEKINKQEKLLKTKLENAKGADNIKEEISKLKRQAVFLLKNQ